MMHGYGFGGGWFGMGLWWIVLLAAVIAVVWAVARRSHPSRANESALDVLEKRYARGEIKRDEFEQKKRDLSS